MTDVKSEALRYLGYRGNKPDDATSALLDKAYDELAKAAVPRYISKLSPKNDVSYLLKGNDIAAHLSASSRVIIFAATLGSAADRLIRTAEITNMAYALILDALASAFIEQVCEDAERELHEKNAGFFTWRFSPGYGDYPLDVQSDIVRYLDADKRIGLTVTGSDILIPRKSVTAVIGISDTEQAKGIRGCATCNLRKTCNYRKTGITCAI